MNDFQGVSSWERLEGGMARLTLIVDVPIDRINNCLQGKQLKAAEKITDAKKAYTNACYTSPRGAIAACEGVVKTAGQQQFSCQLQVFAAGVKLAGEADTISAADYLKLQAAGGSRV